jgi:predicted PurR-regulated permease PerM
MTEHKETNRSPDPFQLTILIFAVIAFMYFTGPVLKTLIVSILLSFALAPVVGLLERARFPRALAVILTVLITLGALGGVGYLVGAELASLVKRLPDYQENIETKLTRILKPAGDNAAVRLKSFADEIKAKIQAMPKEVDDPKTEGKKNTSIRVAETDAIPKVEVVSQPSILEQLRSAGGPYLEFLGEAGFVLVLVLFILIGREGISDRIVTLFGNKHISLTTRTTREISRRISRYLGTFALVNSCYGLTIGIALSIIGVPYSILWGCMAAMLRFFPYIGPAVAFVLPFLFSFAFFESWLRPLEVVAVFAVVEILLNGYLEPVIYGKTTGISALSLLVAAMFWTWMWGTLGLLVSTPLTVCLAVLGKHVDSLRFFATLLGETAEMEPNLRFYERLIALDEPGALAVVETSLKEQPRIDVFDDLLLKALVRAERDAARDELDESKLAFIGRVVGEILDRLDGTPEFSLEAASQPSLDASNLAMMNVDHIEKRIVGVVLDKPSDALALRMLGRLLDPSRIVFEIIADPAASSAFADQSLEPPPQSIVVSHLPPGPLSGTEYLVNRIRTRLPNTPIVVGLWAHPVASSSDAFYHLEISASHVARSLAEAKAHILDIVNPRSTDETAVIGAEAASTA